MRPRPAATCLRVVTARFLPATGLLKAVLSEFVEAEVPCDGRQQLLLMLLLQVFSGAIGCLDLGLPLPLSLAACGAAPASATQRARHAGLPQHTITLRTNRSTTTATSTHAARARVGISARPTSAPSAPTTRRVVATVPAILAALVPPHRARRLVPSSVTASPITSAATAAGRIPIAGAIVIPAVPVRTITVPVVVTPVLVLVRRGVAVAVVVALTLPLTLSLSLSLVLVNLVGVVVVLVVARNVAGVPAAAASESLTRHPLALLALA